MLGVNFTFELLNKCECCRMTEKEDTVEFYLIALGPTYNK